MPEGPVSDQRDGALIAVRVQPRASRSELLDVRDGELRVRLAAPPVEGAANAALIALLAKRLERRQGDIEVVSGQQGRHKRVLVRGVTAAVTRERLQLPVQNDSGSTP